MLEEGYSYSLKNVLESNGNLRYLKVSRMKNAHFPTELPEMLSPRNSSRLVRPELWRGHLNHFGILGSSPPKSREGSLYK